MSADGVTAPSSTGSSELESKVKIWERAIQTQMHFAELSIKMRQLGITLVGGAIALAIVLLRTESHFSIQIYCIVIPVSSILCFAAGAMLYWAKEIDVGVYHRMLRGSVEFNRLFEQQLDEEVAWKSGLTEAISAYSQYKSPKRADSRGDNGSHWYDSAKGVERAGDRLTRAYRIAIWALVGSGVAFWLVANFGEVIE